MNQQHKRCTKCYTVKPLNCYSRQKSGALGRKSECKKCQVKANMTYRHKRSLSKTNNAYCWRCGMELSKERFLSERTRMLVEEKRGMGVKLAECAECAVLPRLSPREQYEQKMRERHKKV